MPKVKMTLEGLDGNAFAILGVFRREARKQGWPEAEIERVSDEAKAGDYDHLLQTIISNTEEQ